MKDQVFDLDLIKKTYQNLSEKVIDAAVLWEKDSYEPGTYMSISFQYQKHLFILSHFV